MFNINLSTLKFFTSGLRMVLFNEIMRYKESSKDTTSASVEGNQRTILNYINNEDSLHDSFSEVSFKPRKKQKTEKLDLSQSTFEFPDEISDI